MQGQLAGEQIAQQIHAPLLQRPAEEGVDVEQAGQVNVVLGERRAAGQRHAAEHALRGMETVPHALTAAVEEAIDLDEIRAIERHVDGQNAQADAFEPRDIDRAGHQFGEYGQTFLRRRDAW